MAAELDDVDIRLLTALQADADRTNVELARIAGLSPAATLHRVRWLKESGVIRIISASLDPAAAGFPLQLYVAATLARHDPRSTRGFEAWRWIWGGGWEGRSATWSGEVGGELAWTSRSGRWPRPARGMRGRRSRAPTPRACRCPPARLTCCLTEAASTTWRQPSALV